MGQRAPRGGGDLGSENHKALFYQWLADVGHSFVEFAKQASYTWLKICLFGLFLKYLGI